MEQQAAVNHPMSGFLYNPKLLYAPLRYLPLALEGLKPFDDHNYMHRWYTAPPDPGVPILAGTTLDTQLRIVPGSVIVGGRFATYSVTDDPAPSPSLMAYLIRDGDTQKSFVDGESRYVNCNSLVPTGATGAAFSMFAKPYCVSGSGNDNGGGVITVSLSNLSTTADINCQILLYVLEAAQIETTSEYGSIMVPRTQQAHPMQVPTINGGVRVGGHQDRVNHGSTGGRFHGGAHLRGGHRG